MKIDMLYSKIHRATVTDANLNYVGSITIDEELIRAANLHVGQKVDIVNVNNGERLSTYVIKGEPKSGKICLNGAAARKVHIGDIIIIIAYASMELDEAKDFKPAVVFVDEKNTCTHVKDHLGHV